MMGPNHMPDLTQEGLAAREVPERICPDCRSRHYARCDERLEDGKFHSGSILRCIECKTTYLDPALAVSPEVQALIRDAEARGYNNGMLTAISVVAEERNKRNPGPLFEVLNKALGKIDDARFAAIRSADAARAPDDPQTDRG